MSEDNNLHIAVIGSGSAAMAAALKAAKRAARLGSQITVLARSRRLSSEDPASGEAIEAAFRREGITVLTQTQARHVDYTEHELLINTNNGRLHADQPLVATGRTTPATVATNSSLSMSQEAAEPPST